MGWEPEGTSIDIAGLHERMGDDDNIRRVKDRVVSVMGVALLAGVARQLTLCCGNRPPSMVFLGL